VDVSGCIKKSAIIYSSLGKIHLLLFISFQVLTVRTRSEHRSGAYTVLAEKDPHTVIMLQKALVH
jgi:hypothetical protein